MYDRCAQSLCAPAVIPKPAIKKMANSEKKIDRVASKQYKHFLPFKDTPQRIRELILAATTEHKIKRKSLQNLVVATVALLCDSLKSNECFQQTL